MDNQLKWDLRYLDLSDHIASWSKDPRTKVGSVIVNKERGSISSMGFNGFPRFVEDHIDRYADPEIKNLLVAHAERNALDNSNGSVVGHTIYSSLFPCSECAKSIIQKGISRVVSWQLDPMRYESLKWKYSILLLREGGVDIAVIDQTTRQFIQGPLLESMLENK